MDKKSEVSMSEYRKLALRYKTLEAQFRQTVPKKEYNETVTKLEKQVDGLEKELDRAKADLQKFSTLGKQLGGISDSMVSQGKATAALNRAIESLSFRLSQGSIPALVHNQALARVRELEEQVRGMVSRTEYDSLNQRCEDLRRDVDSMVPSGEHSVLKQRAEELSRQMSLMVPGSEYAALKQRYEDLENSISSMVPKSQLESSDAKVKELEARLAEQVPQAVYDELVSKVVSLAEEVTGGSKTSEESVTQTEATEETIGTTEEPFSDFQEPSPPDYSEPTPEFQSEPVPEFPENQPSEEISEVQAQLAEISSAQIEAPDLSLTEDQAMPEAPSEGKPQTGSPSPIDAV